VVKFWKELIGALIGDLDALSSFFSTKSEKRTDGTVEVLENLPFMIKLDFESGSDIFVEVLLSVEELVVVFLGALPRGY
jgi:CRISPR/Cas system-associated protein Cas10 (large subunit of type III CRISPR-Cas system)